MDEELLFIPVGRWILDITMISTRWVNIVPNLISNRSFGNQLHGKWENQPFAELFFHIIFNTFPIKHGAFSYFSEDILKSGGFQYISIHVL